MMDSLQVRRVLLGTTILLGLATVPSGSESQEISLPLGSKAPAAALEDLDGNAVQLLDYLEEGKPTLIEFWASWCENCEALQPQLDQIQSRWGSQINIVAVAVAVSQSLRRVRLHVEEHRPGYPYLWDGKGEAVRAFNVLGTSVVVLLDEGGKVVYTGTGGGQDLVGKVAELIGN
jgi:thiol-disulfide isomerase/thioredoxin